MPIGGHITIPFTTLLLALPPIIGYSALRDTNCTFASLAVGAFFSGIGGGAFASSMSNISFFFPKAKQGLALGLNAGIGNLGVSLTQLLVPIMMTYAAFGQTDPIGYTRVYNGAMWWFPFCIVMAVLGWMYMSDMPQHGNKPFLQRVYYYASLNGQAYACSAIAYGVAMGTFRSALMDTPNGRIGRIFILVFIAGFLMHVSMWFLSPGEVKAKLVVQSAIFKNKHTWIMTWLYIMSFGSFIGYSNAFPKLIQDLFEFIKDDDGNEIANPNAPNCGAVSCNFLGPLIGSLIRPIGGWLSDKFGGALVTQVDLAIMIASTIGVGVVIQQAYDEPKTPEKHFPAFFGLFMILFATTGIANGSTFKQISAIFLNIGQPEQAGPVLGWSSAIASYGAAIIPGVLGVAVTQKNVPNNMYGFAGYYITCFILNFWCYLRPGADTRC